MPVLDNDLSKSRVSTCSEKMSEKDSRFLQNRNCVCQKSLDGRGGLRKLR